MKRFLITLIAIALILPEGCKQKEEEKAEGPIAKKYAKYRVAVRKDKDLKNWLATLEKAEAVDLLTEEKYTNEKGNQFDLSRVKLADDTLGYIESRHLADKPIVFTKETRSYVRPTSGSKVYMKISPGTIGFIIGEKGNWVQIYIGQIKGKWITKQWVEGGYSTDSTLLQEAKELEVAINLIKKEETMDKGIEKLKELADSTTEIALIAQDKLKELGEKKEEPGETKEEGEYKDMSEKEELESDDPEKRD
jgi:hypothetical protein